MKILLCILAFLLGCGCIRAQERETKKYIFGNISSESSSDNHVKADESFDEATGSANNNFSIRQSTKKKSPFELLEAGPKAEKIGIPETDIKNRLWVKPPDKSTEAKFHWKPALIQSFIFLGFQHGYRLATQKGTRGRLAGPFFRDWLQSVKNLRGWRDGNRFYINYLGHPLQGGLTGKIFVNNSDRSKNLEFGNSKKYWVSRFKAMAWSAVWSTQFELGPIGEANIGNVGLAPVGRHSSMAYIDLVMTPVLGTGVLIGEDAIDKFILKNRLEKKGSGKMKIKILRTLLTPTTSIANLLRGKAPWKRDMRLL